MVILGLILLIIGLIADIYILSVDRRHPAVVGLIVNLVPMGGTRRACSLSLWAHRRDRRGSARPAIGRVVVRIRRRWSRLRVAAQLLVEPELGAAEEAGHVVDQLARARPGSAGSVSV